MVPYYNLQSYRLAIIDQGMIFNSQPHGGTIYSTAERAFERRSAPRPNTRALLSRFALFFLCYKCK